ncbi:hypothetical protein [Siminovitchia fortis]|uniref:hypothetical protein n=1 Tax=Siminovitchia fortis TaxID=254758 RepID=UPI00119DB088|nr:hypothetical protein [Siminovitchia fortis]
MINPGHKGIYKQSLIRKERIPPVEAKTRAEDMLWDEECLRIFTDASELMRQGIFGLGICFIGQGQTSVKSKKHYNPSMKAVNVYAELVAVEFAVDELLKAIHNNNHALPSRIRILSDWNEVEKLKITSKITKNNAINKVAERINEKTKRFSALYPDFDLDLTFIGKDERRYNPYYTAAHNAAKKIIR